MIRKSTTADIPRIAETAVFAKRMAYRTLIENDKMLFNTLGVLNTAGKLKNPDSLSHLYVFDDGVLKGTVNLNFNENSAEITDIYVDPFFQQNGIGGRLLKFAENEAKNKNCETLKAYIYKENSSAVQFFENFGFSETGKKEKDNDFNIELSQFSKNL